LTRVCGNENPSGLLIRSYGLTARLRHLQRIHNFRGLIGEATAETHGQTLGLSGHGLRAVEAVREERARHPRLKVLSVRQAARRLLKNIDRGSAAGQAKLVENLFPAATPQHVERGRYVLSRLTVLYCATLIYKKIK